MNQIFKYNSNAKYSIKDLKGGYNNNNFSLLDAYLNRKGPNVKIHLLNIFKDHHIVAKSCPMAVSCSKCLLSNALLMTFLNSYGKYKPKLNKYFYMMYHCQLKL